MTAEQIYQELDRAGLTPPVHYCAAPHEWRMALERIEELLEEWLNTCWNEARTFAEPKSIDTGASLLESLRSLKK